MTKTKMVLATMVAAVLTFGVAACGPQAEVTPEEAAPAAVTEPAPVEAPVVPPVDPAAAPVDPAAPAPAPVEAPKTP